MPHEELHLFSDQRLLITMCASVNDVRYIVRRTLELIEQSRVMMRELDIHRADGSVAQPTSARPPSAAKPRILAANH